MAFGVDMRVKNLFFDKEEVIRRTDAKTRVALSKIGLDIRQAARGLLGKTAKTNRPRPPGKPPRTHSKNDRVSLRNILFGLEGKATLIVGPVRLNQKQRGGPVPGLHEFGGSAAIKEKMVAGEWVGMGRRKARPGQKTRFRRVQYPDRRFMEPALMRVAKRKKLGKYWASGAASLKVSAGDDATGQFPELWT